MQQSDGPWFDSGWPDFFSCPPELRRNAFAPNTELCFSSSRTHTPMPTRKTSRPATQAERLSHPRMSAKYFWDSRGAYAWRGRRPRRRERERERERSLQRKALGGGAKHGWVILPGKKGKFSGQKFFPIGRIFAPTRKNTENKNQSLQNL